MSDVVTILPDGSACSFLSFPLPKDHWLYAPRGEWDAARDDYAECPLPILTNAQRDAVMAAARYAIRGATMCGKDMDFDPDAMVLNFAYALCGPSSGPVLPADLVCSSAAETQHEARSLAERERNRHVADGSRSCRGLASEPE